MSVVSLVPVASGALFIIYGLRVLTSQGHTKNLWVLPAAASFSFLMFSLYAVVQEGPLGFWTEHTRNLWGNQIWLDLLLAASIGWFLIVPQAKSLGMRQRTRERGHHVTLSRRRGARHRLLDLRLGD